jgi:putative nucleotidyltransferase with HDIG domain
MVAGAGAAFVLGAFGPAAQPNAWPQVLGPSLLAALVHYGISCSLVSLAVSLTTKGTVHGVWNEKFRWLWPHYLVLGILALAIASAYQLIGLWGLAIFLAPPAMMHFALKQYVERTTKNVLELKQAHKELQTAHSRVVEAMERLKGAYDGTLSSLVAALDARDSETRGHSERVAELTLAIAEGMGMERDSAEWQDIRWGALLHDVGKIGVPDGVLRKPGALTDTEWTLMRNHPTAGYEILKGVEFLGRAVEIVYTHHERYDGRGYPRGLQGEEIPFGARIFAVADAFDAMTSDRPYRAAMAPADALGELLRNSGSQFDPQAVEAFLKISWKIFRHRASKNGGSGPAPAYEPAEATASKS